MNKGSKNLGPVSWDETTKTCKVNSNRHFSALTSLSGFKQKPQEYIVQIDESTVESEWTFNRKAANKKQKFDFGVSIQFTQLTSQESKVDDFSEMELPFSSDIFYPFLSKSAATASSVAMLIAVGVAALAQ